MVSFRGKNILIETIVIYALLSSVSRGIDYLNRPEDSINSLRGMETAAPLWFWGEVFLFFSLLGLVGELLFYTTKKTYRWAPSWIAHSALFALLLIFGVSVVISSIHQGWGWAPGVNMIGFAMLHFFASLRRKESHYYVTQ